MSADRESDSITSRPIGASLVPLRREAQEANLIERLRQKAGPAAIDYAVRTLVEEVYVDEPSLQATEKPISSIVKCQTHITGVATA